MSTHSEIIHAFVTGKGPKRGHNVFREPFYNGNGDTIFSYGTHFPMALRFDNDKIFVINGDRYSVTTSKHQTWVRGAIESRTLYRDYAVITVPLSIFNRAYHYYDISRLHFKVIDVGQDREIIKCRTCDLNFDSWGELDKHRWSSWNSPGPKHQTTYFHQLAPSAFSMTNGDDKPTYFLSAFDETANQRNHDGYFLVQLPHKPRDIGHAYEMLKPKEVKIAEKNGLKVSRQGDIFAIPTTLDTRSLKRKGIYERGSMEEHSYWGTTYKRLDYPRLLSTSHVATETVIKKDRVYARGVIRHRPTTFGRTMPEHINITLGKMWHRIVRNTAVASYSTGGRVD